MPSRPLPRGIDVTFDDMNELIASGWTIIGGGEVPGHVEAGCGPMTSSTFLHFYKVGDELILFLFCF